MSIKVGDKDLFPYLGDYRPVNIYNGENKIAGWKWAEQSGGELYFENTYNDFVEVEMVGKSYQESEPSPDNPIEIRSVNDFEVVSSVEKLTEGQLEEYDYDTEYENIYKINLSLSEPLRSVGDVKDRLFRDSDGLWKIERNVGELIYNGGRDGGWIRLESFDRIQIRSFTESDPPNVYTYKTNMFVYYPNGSSKPSSGIYLQNHGLDIYNRFWIIDMDRRFSSDADAKAFFSNNPLQIHYDLHEPIIENIPQELQDKLNNLRSFQDSNYVYTVVENLKPTLHARLKVKDI